MRRHIATLFEYADVHGNEYYPRDIRSSRRGAEGLSTREPVSLEISDARLQASSTHEGEKVSQAESKEKEELKNQEIGG